MADGAAGLTIMLHLSKRADRIPVVLPSLACAPEGSDVLLQVKRKELALCNAHCRNASASLRRCRCAAEVAWPQLQHTNVATHGATGERDLLFAHGDMWLNLAQLRASSWFANDGGKTIVTPSRGGVGALWAARGAAHIDVASSPELPGPACLDAAAMQEGCRSVNASRSGFFRNKNGSLLLCEDVAWTWPMMSNTQCAAAAAAATPRVAECCVGWADLVYLPRAVHAPFRALAATFRNVFHEVALPTILNALHARGEARWVPGLECAGSCCADIRPLRRALLRTPCAHRVPLQARPDLSCAPERGARPARLASARHLHRAAHGASLNCSLNPHRAPASSSMRTRGDCVGF